MKNTFAEGNNNRDIAYFNSQVEKLRKDLQELTGGSVAEEEIITYIDRLSQQAVAFNKNSDSCFWALDDPNHMPADARVDYIYVPTYLASSILVYSILHYERIRTIPEVLSLTRKALNGCLGRSSGGLHFVGAGYSGIDGFLDAMDIFADGHMEEFTRRYPDVNPDFTKAWNAAVRYLKERVCSGDSSAPWDSRCCVDRGKAILEKTKMADGEKQLLFVYGTLMSGRSAAHMLEGKVCRGTYLLREHAMYDLGWYPGVVRQNGEAVVGEVYEIEEDDFNRLDEYEDNGNLYCRRKLQVERAQEKTTAWVYIYQGEPGEKLCRHPWGSSDKDPVWYAAYGSNLSRDRFLCYIRGEACAENGKHYSGCSIKSLPEEEGCGWFPGELYFANSSISWDGKGVAFYDPYGKGETFMRLYRITRGQLQDIQKQEGLSARWYGRIVTLGIQKDGIPICTLTSEHRNSRNLPSDKYSGLMLKALVKENGLDETEAQKYLKDAIHH